MTELSLYKFFFDKDEGIDPEIKWHGNELIVLLNYRDCADFFEMFGADYFVDGGITDVTLMESHIGLDLVPHLENFDIEPENIYPKPKDRNIY